MTGVFISRGITFAIKDLSISVDADGNVTASSVTPHVRFDVCPTWIELALKHLDEAKSRSEHLAIVWKGDDGEEKAKALEREFESSMQAIMASAIAVDAFYAMIKDNVSLPPSLLARWRSGQTSRYRQVTEVIRRAFRLKPKGTKILRENLKEIYRIRDLAVHPSGKLQAAVLHPDLDTGVEWRFALFRAKNAELVLTAVIGHLWDLAHNGHPKDEATQNYMSNLRDRLDELFPSGLPDYLTAPSET